MRIATFLLALGLITTPALAFEIEEIGLLTATFGEESISQPTVIAKADGKASPMAYFTVVGGGFSLLSFSGFMSDNSRLDISATFQSEALSPQKPPFQLDIQYKAPGEKGYWTSDGAPIAASIAFTVLDHDDKEGQAVGSFSGALCYAESYETDADSENCRPIEGNFDTKFFIE
jgi:hypothetical protein